MRDAVGVRVESIEGQRARVRVFLLDPSRAKLPRARPFFEAALGVPVWSVRQVGKQNWPIRKKSPPPPAGALRAGAWANEERLPQGLYEVTLVEGGPDGAVGVGVPTAAQDEDEVPECAAARARRQERAPFEVQIEGLEPVGREALRALALDHLRGHLLVDSMRAAHEGEQAFVRVELSVRALCPNRGLSLEPAFVLRLLAAGQAEGAAIDEDWPLLFGPGPLRAGGHLEVLLLWAEYTAPTPERALSALRRWQRAGPELRHASPWGEGEAARIGCVVVARQAAGLRLGQRYRAHAWGAYGSVVQPRDRWLLGRAPGPVGRWRERARLGEREEEPGGLEGLILMLRFGPAGEVWVGTDKGLFEVEVGAGGVSARRVLGPRYGARAMVVEGEQRWLACDARGLVAWEEERMIEHGKMDGLPGGTVLGVARYKAGQRAGRLLVSTNNGVVEGRPGDWRLLPKAVARAHARPLVDGAVAWFLCEKSVGCLVGDEERVFRSGQGVGSVWQGVCHEGALWVLHQKDGVNQVLRLTPEAKRAEVVAWVPPVLSQRARSLQWIDGALWLGLIGGGLARVAEGEAPRCWMRARPIAMPTVLMDEIRGVHRDPRRPLLWVQGIRSLSAVRLADLGLAGRPGAG